MTNDPLGLGSSLDSTYTGVFKKEETPAKKLLEPYPKRTNCYIVRIDNSTLEKWQTCPRAWEYYAIHGREKPGSPALNFGSACHEGWEILGRYGNSPEVVQKMKEKVTQHFIENPQPDGEYRNLEYAVEMLEKYAEQYKLSICSTAEHDGEKLVEFPFSLALGKVHIGGLLGYQYQELLNTNVKPPEEWNNYPEWIADTYVYVDDLYFFWTGKIDQIVVNEGRHWVMDHKTTSMGGPTFFADFQLAQQTIGYVWAAQKLWPDFDFAGFLLDAAICRRKTKTGKGLEFTRQFFPYEQWHLDEWEEDVKSQIGSCVDQLTNRYFPKKTKWCMGKYGACPYHEVCTLAPSQREVMLNSSNYGNVTWSPLNK